MGRKLVYGISINFVIESEGTEGGMSKDSMAGSGGM